MKKLLLLVLALCLGGAACGNSDLTANTNPDGDLGNEACPSTDEDSVTNQPTDGDPDSENAPEDDAASEAEQADEEPANCVCSEVGVCCDGCNAINDGTPCNDNNICTLQTECQAGECSLIRTSLDCRDENPCSEDICVADIGCVYHELENYEFTGLDGALYHCLGFEAIQACYNDDDCNYIEPTGNLCIVEYECTSLGRTTRGGGGPCVPKFRNGESCGDGKVCDGWECLPEQCQCSGVSDCCDGCHAINAGNSCGSDNACMINGTCGENGKCYGENINCPDDGNPCTVESCDQTLGCISTPMDDYGQIMDDPASLLGVCLHGTMYPTCTPDNPSSCTNGFGCNLVNRECNADGTNCWGYYLCAPSADDHNYCTTDFFIGEYQGSQMFGHGILPAGTPCKDGNGCTQGDTCDDNANCIAGPTDPCAETDRPFCLDMNSPPGTGEGHYCAACQTDLDCAEGLMCQNMNCVQPQVLGYNDLFYGGSLVLGEFRVLRAHLFMENNSSEDMAAMELRCDSNCFGSTAPEAQAVNMGNGDSARTQLANMNGGFRGTLALELNLQGGNQEIVEFRVTVPTGCQNAGSWLQCDLFAVYDHWGINRLGSNVDGAFYTN